jgi:hypothetical protein
MTITTIITALQSRHAAVDGVATAPTAYPASIEASDCPCVLVDPWRGKTSWDSHGGDLAIAERLCRVRVFYQPAAFNLDQGKQGAIALLEAMLADYRANATLTDSAAILLERDIEDTGIVENLPYGENTYHGFTIVLPVEERIEDDE